MPKVNCECEGAGCINCWPRDNEIGAVNAGALDDRMRKAADAAICILELEAPKYWGERHWLENVRPLIMSVRLTCILAKQTDSPTIWRDCRTSGNSLRWKLINRELGAAGFDGEKRLLQLIDARRKELGHV